MTQNKKAFLDFSIPLLYIIIDARKDILEKLKGIIKAGADIVQIRDKNLSDRELVGFGHKARKIIRGRAFFFINDRFDIALAAGAQGIHLGQDDMSPEAVRRIAKKKLLIGLSTHTAKEVKASITRPVDYISFGPIFKTKTKLDALSPRGIKRLKKAVSCSSHPVVAIGGINLKNAADVLKTGVSGIAVSSAILDKSDTYRATLEFRRVLTLNNIVGSR